MKYIFIGLILAFFGFTNTLTAVAQQQINNNGATGGDLQQYINGSVLQNAPADQQTSPVTPNAGAKTLQNAPNAPLTVTGQQPSQEASDNNNDRSIFGWLTLSVLLLLLLMSPALLYTRSLSKKEQAIAAPVGSKTKQKEPQVVEAPPKEPTKKASVTTKTPKKKSKKSANKVKRKKKKK